MKNWITSKILNVLFTLLQQATKVGYGIVTKVISAVKYILDKINTFADKNPKLWRLIIITVVIFVMLIVCAASAKAATTGSPPDKEMINQAIGLLKSSTAGGDNMIQMKAMAYLVKLRDGAPDVDSVMTYGKEAIQTATSAIESLKKAKESASGMDLTDILSKYASQGAEIVGATLKNVSGSESVKLLYKEHIRSQVRKVLLNEMEKIYGFDVIGITGSGDNGMAYELSNGNILKVTTSSSEAYIAHKLIGKNLKHVANVYWIKKSKDKYIYEVEKLDTNWSDSDRQLWDVLIMIIDDDYMLEEFQNMSHNEKIAYLTELGFDEREGIPDEDRINFFINGLKSVSQELESTHKSLLKAMDLGIDNFGIKNGELAVFDLDYQTNLVDTSIEDL
jgi:hypothetical protein